VSKARIGEVVAVLVGYTAIWMAVTWDVVTNWGSRIFGVAGDPVGSTWWLWQYARYLGYSLVGTTTITMSGAPIGWTRGDAVNLQAVLIYGPATLAAKVFGPVSAYNLMVLTGMVLSAAAMYWLVRYIGLSWPIAAWAGVAYMFFPWHTLKADIHVTLAHLELFPVLVIAALWWLKRPSWRRALVVGAVGLALWLSSGYFGIVAFVGICVVTVVGWIVTGRRTGRWGSALGPAILPAAFGAAASALVYGVGRIGGGMSSGLPAQDARGLDIYGARLHEFFLPVGANPVFGRYTGDYLAANMHGSNDVETPLYLGWVTIVLAIVAIAWLLVARHQVAPVQRLAVVLGVALAVVAGLFMLPSPYEVFGRAWTTPIGWVYRVTPSFRVPTRFMPLLMTAVVLLAAVGLGLLIRRVRAVLPSARVRTGATIAVCAVLAALSFAELTTVPPGATYDVGEKAWVPLVRRAPEGVLAQYPLGGSVAPEDPENLLQQTFHKRPLGFNAPEGTLAEELRTEVIDPTAPGTPERLAGLGVTAVTLWPKEQEHEGVIIPARTSLGHGYRLIGRVADGTSVWQVVARPVPAVAIPWTGFGRLELKGRPQPRRWMIARDGEVAIYSRTGGVVDASFLVGSWQRPRALRVAGAGGAVGRRLPAWKDTRVTLRLRVPAGLSGLRLAVRPGPSRGPQGQPLALYMTRWSFRAAPASDVPALQAQPLPPGG